MNMMECPRCKEIALELTDEEISDDNTMSYSTYECGSCGHLEIHSGSLPSWYRAEKFEGVSPQKPETGGHRNEDD